MRRLEDSLNGGYKGLYGEVVTSDCYRLKSIRWEPDVIFDVGANIGIFARFARTVFPNALIACLEPDPENAKLFRLHTKDDATILVEKALGQGQIYHGLTAANGSGETYLSAGLGYPRELIDVDPRVEKSRVRATTLNEFTRPFRKEEGIHLLKLDCEGAENFIWAHPPSLEEVRKMDYIVAEFHDYAVDHNHLEEVRLRTWDVIESLRETHVCERDGVHFWATRKGLC